MNPYYRIEALTHYPEWHKQPLRLTIPEIENPWLVLQDFFSIYHLTGIRRILDQLLETSIIADDEDTRSFFFDIKNLHRLTEAAWLLHQQKKEQQPPTSETAKQTIAGEEEEENEESEDKQLLFQKPVRLMDKVSQQPLGSLQIVFNTVGTKDLKNIIAAWLNTALTTNTEPYHSATERAGAMAFCIRLKYLIEAACIISRRAQIREQKGIDVNNYNQLTTQLFSTEGIEDLSEEEIEQPCNIVKDFFSRFPLLHSRAELWDLFGAVIKTNDNNRNKTEHLVNYQHLYTIIEALQTLQKHHANSLKFDAS